MFTAEKGHELLNNNGKAYYALWESESVSMMCSKWCHPTCSCSWDKDLVHIARINGEDIGVLEADLLVKVEGVFCHCFLLGLPEPYVPVVYFDPAHSGLVCLSYMHWPQGLQFLRMLHGIGRQLVTRISGQLLGCIIQVSAWNLAGIYSPYCWIHSRCSKWLPLVTLWLLSPSCSPGTKLISLAFTHNFPHSWESPAGPTTSEATFSFSSYRFPSYTAYYTVVSARTVTFPWGETTDGFHGTSLITKHEPLVYPMVTNVVIHILGSLWTKHVVNDNLLASPFTWLQHPNWDIEMHLMFPAYAGIQDLSHDPI